MRRMHSSVLSSLIVHCNIRAILSIEEGRYDKKRMKPMFGYVSKITQKLRAPTTAEREMDYLNQSVDRVDLEYRQRQIDRGMFRNRGINFL
jgi:hypothetical protein